MIGAEVASDDEACRDEAEEPDAAGDKVQQPVPAHRPRPVGRTGWEAQGRVGDEDPGGDQTGAVHTEQDGEPRCRRVGPARTGGPRPRLRSSSGP